MNMFRMGLEIGAGQGGSGRQSQSQTRPGTPGSNMGMGPPTGGMGMQPHQRTNSMQPNPSNGFLNPNMLGSRPGSSNGLHSMNRLTMMTGNGDAHSMHGAMDSNRYTPSIAPSERSNIGQASRYRPVQSQMMDGASGIISNATSTIRVTEKSKAMPLLKDDDDDEGWGTMKKKKKSKARGQEDDSGLGALGYL